MTKAFMQIDPVWCIVEDSFDVSCNRIRETLFTTGNGYISIRGCLEEGLSDDPQNLSYERRVDNISLERVQPGKSKWGTYVPGFMAPHPALGRQMLNLPWFSDISIIERGEKVDMERSHVNEYARWLNLKTATLNRQFEWKTKSGAVLRISFARFAHMVHKHLIVQLLNIECLKGTAEIVVTGGINSDVRTNGFDHFTNTEISGDTNIMKMAVETNGGDSVFIASTFLNQMAGSNLRRTARFIETDMTFQLAEGQKRELAKLTSIFTSWDDEASPVTSSSPADFLSKLDMPASQLRASHEDACKKKWDKADVVIEGDPQSQLAMRFAVYHLIRACPPNDCRAGVGSRLASGDLYCGHVFWDNEIFLLPFYLYTDPPAARDIVRYRHVTLEGARNKARRYGYPGAMYAWQSASDGEENCVAWQYSDLQIHISADVVFGIWHYYTVTRDETCLTDFGAEIFLEVARYFAARADKRPGDDYYSILGVMGPDEYTHFSHNNAYTNRLAKFVFEKALWVAEHMRGQYPERFDEIAQRIGLTDDELRTFRETGEALLIPHDAKRDLVLQSEDFEKLAPIDLNEFWKERSKPFGLVMSQERRYRSQCLKQPDVLMLMYLFPNEFTDEQKRIAFEFYEPKTCHDSSLSHPIHNIMAARLGLDDRAYDYWVKAAFLDMDGMSSQTADGLHESSLGGSWQAVIFGFAGMGPAHASGELRFSPRLPKKWKHLSFHIQWHGREHRVDIDHTGAKVSEVN